ncbi:MAG TPA: hypothetical protein PL160_00695, partial [Candidatus Cloacimonas sp.]|nr:hypothetical protein [Candidatus Cloacimonas sp.]
RRMFAQGIKLEQQSSEPVPSLKMSEIHLQQMLINLLNHHMSLLESSSVKNRILRVDISCDKGISRFRLLQNGTKITPEMINRLYNPLNTEGNAEMDMAIVKYLCDHYRFQMQVSEGDGFWGICLILGQ